MSEGTDPASAITVALTGARVPTSGLDSVAEDLARAGFDADRLAEIRALAQRDQVAWPFPVPMDELRSIGFARFEAALADVRRALHLDGLRIASAAHRPLDRDEQRLSAERPPHWG